MYAWIWRKLPFGLPGKIVGMLLLAAAAVATLWYGVFPVAERLMPFNDVQVTGTTDGAGGAVNGPAGPGPSANPSDFVIPYSTVSNGASPAHRPSSQAPRR